jgi:hypothetical protein
MMKMPTVGATDQITCNNKVEENKVGSETAVNGRRKDS